MELSPFIYFYGRCQEALEFYKRALNGNYEIVQRNPDDDPRVSPEARGKVSYARFWADGLTFAASDGGSVRDIGKDEGNISLSLAVPSSDEANRIYRSLVDGGEVVAPWGDAPWGGKFGIATDRFATQWIVTSPIDRTSE